MSRSNARIPVAALAGWQEGDLDSVIPLIAPGAELRPLRSQLEGTRYVGPGGAREIADDLRRDWKSLAFEPDETHEDGENVVLLGRSPPRRGRAPRRRHADRVAVDRPWRTNQVGRPTRTRARP